MCITNMCITYTYIKYMCIIYTNFGDGSHTILFQHAKDITNHHAGNIEELFLQDLFSNSEITGNRGHDCMDVFL